MRAGRRLEKASRSAASLEREWPPRTAEARELSRRRSDALRACLADLGLACLIARESGVGLSPGQLTLARLCELERGLDVARDPA